MRNSRANPTQSFPAFGIAGSAVGPKRFCTASRMTVTDASTVNKSKCTSTSGASGGPWAGVMPVNSRIFIGAGPAVETLHVPGFADGQRRVHEHLEKIARRKQVARPQPVSPIRRNERGEADQSGIGPQTGDQGGPADIFVPVRFAETRIAAQTSAQPVAINEKSAVSGIEQTPVNGDGEHGFAGAAQAGDQSTRRG